MRFRTALAGSGFLLLMAAAAPRARADEGPSEMLRRQAAEFVKKRAEEGKAVPEFPKGREWLNVSRPLTFGEDLKGRVVVLDFWCYCCINCMHVLPDLEYLEKRYEGKAFAVVGVHSAKFLNEKDTENIRQAVVRYEIQHPVVNDGEFEIWRAFDAHSWPTLAVVAPDGRLLYKEAGEGHRDELEAIVDAALEHYGAKGLLAAKPLPVRLERSRRAPAELAYPGKVAVDAARSSLFVSDSNHHRVLELGLDGKFRRAWGNGERGLADGRPDAARFFRPQGLAVRDGVVWVADTENHAIRRIDLSSGEVSTVAGDGKQGSVYEGTHEGRSVRLSSPWDVLFLGETLFVAMAGTHQIWTLDRASGRVAHHAGNGGELRRDSAQRKDAGFAQPSGLATDGTSIYVADSESSSIVRIAKDGRVSTLAGANENERDLFDFGDMDGVGRAAKFQHPLAVAYHDGLLYVADSYNHKLKTLDPATGTVTTRWGEQSSGLADDPPRFSEPGGLAVHGKTLYVADTNNHAIRTIDLTTGKVSTLRTSGVPVPQSAAREGGRSGAWPALPGTALLALPVADVHAGEGTSLRVQVILPDGWHLTAGAPSAVRIEGLGEPIERKMDASEVKIPLPAIPEAGGALTVRLLYYACQDQGTCRVRSATYSVPLRVAPKADATVAVVDRFVP